MNKSGDSNRGERSDLPVRRLSWYSAAVGGGAGNSLLFVMVHNAFVKKINK